MITVFLWPCGETVEVEDLLPAAVKLGRIVRFQSIH